MGLRFFDFLKKQSREVHGDREQVLIHELYEAATEYKIRNLCWMVCVDIIANILGRCEIKTYEAGKEIKEKEYYMWNVEPNTNENASQFRHKMVKKLMEDGEVLMISTKKKDGSEGLCVADSFTNGESYPKKENTYTGVKVGGCHYEKTFREQDVMHLSLTHMDLKDIVQGMYDAYYRLYDAAVTAYQWGLGQHWKVHVDEMTSGDEGWAQTFAEMIRDQVKPFLDSNGAVLPEFDGYKYENVSLNQGVKMDSKDLREIINDIFDVTARGFLIPAVLANGKVEATSDANSRMLTICIDPLAKQLQEEAVRKRYGYDEWKRGNYLVVDTSTLIHFDLFANAANIEKLVGSGAYTINDVLRATGQAEINEPWANAHYMTLNIVPIDQAAAQVDYGKGGRKHDERNVEN